MTERAIDIIAFKAAKDAGQVPLLVDVRSVEEFEAGHVAGALNLPLAELAASIHRLDDYEGQELYLICRSGIRSATACTFLASEGHRATNVLGGTLAWQAQGWPTLKGSSP